MQPGPVRCRFPRSARILSTEDFGVILKSACSIRIGRGSASACALARGPAGRVRLGFTVGKSNVPLSVNRSLVKRIMRECARKELPALREECLAGNTGLDISLRWRAPLKGVGKTVTLSEAKAAVRGSTEACLEQVRRSVGAASRRAERCRQGS